MFRSLSYVLVWILVLSNAESFFFFLQSLIKKDRGGQNDATMVEFYEKLKIAYRDPALLPVQFSGNDNMRSSLLRAA